MIASVWLSFGLANLILSARVLDVSETPTLRPHLHLRSPAWSFLRYPSVSLADEIVSYRCLHYQ